jgi:hypothetical protein
MDALGDRHEPIFALKHEYGQAPNACNSTVAQKREMSEIRSMNLEEQDRERRRETLRAFFDANKPFGLKSVNRWATRSGIGEATLRQILDGTRPKNMRADTYEKLARGAGELLNREVRLSELIGTTAELDEKAAKLLSRLTLDQMEKAVAFLESLVPPSNQDDGSNH